MPSFGLNELLTDRTILSRPSMNIVMCLLEHHLSIEPNQKGINLAIRLVAALSACAQVSCLAADERMWALHRLRKLLSDLPKVLDMPLQNLLRTKTEALVKSVTSEEATSQSPSSFVKLEFSGGSAMLDFPCILSAPPFLVTRGLRGIPELLLKQHDYEEPIVRSGKHLMFSPFFKVLVPSPK